MSEWTREFKHRFNPQVRVQYPCTAEESDEEWQDDSRDDDATTDNVEERAYDDRKGASVATVEESDSTRLVAGKVESAAGRLETEAFMWIDFANSVYSSCLITGYMPVFVQLVSLMAAKFPDACPNIVRNVSEVLMMPHGAHGPLPLQP